MTLTLDTAQLAELRTLLGARSMSSALEAALADYLAKIKHFDAVDEWLAEMEREYGPVPPETLEWAAQIVDSWLAKSTAGQGAPRGKAS